MADSYNDRFELLIFEDAIDYVERKRKEKEELHRKAELYKREIEKQGVCEGCGEKGQLRWISYGEIYSCYDCFVHDLDCRASVMVPMRSAESLSEYLSEGEWEELWEMNK
jgi:hypothetical protein